MAKVLWVEDESALREDIADYLRLEAYEVDEAQDGYDALTKLKANQYDAVLSDILMPRMDGFELLRACRAGSDCKENAHTPFIFLSALSNVNDQTKARQMGCTDFLTKPIDFGLLNATLQSRIEQKAKEATAQALARANDVRALQAVYAHELMNPAVQLCEIAEYLSHLKEDDNIPEKLAAMAPFLKEVAERQLRGIEVLRETEAMLHSEVTPHAIELNNGWLEMLAKQMKRRHERLTLHTEPSPTSIHIISSPSCMQRALIYLIEALYHHLKFTSCSATLQQDAHFGYIYLARGDKAITETVQELSLEQCLADNHATHNIGPVIGAFNYTDTLVVRLGGRCTALLDKETLYGVRIGFPISGNILPL